MFTTAQCKDYIATLCSVFALLPAKGWKRTAKYTGQFRNQASVFRDFEHPEGSFMTLVESDDKLFVYQYHVSTDDMHVAEPVADEVWGQKRLTQPPTHAAIFDFMVECTQADPEILQDSKAQTHAADPSAWTIWEHWSSHEQGTEMFLADCHSNVQMLELHYPDEDGNPMSAAPTDIAAIYSVGLFDYDTAFRIWVFVLHDHTLVLGTNNPD